MRMIACMSPASEGELSVLGLDPATDGAAIRGRIVLVPQEDTLDLELTVRDNLYLYGRYFDLPKKLVRARVEELLDFAQLSERGDDQVAQLSERGDDQVDKLSGGMKRRLTIAVICRAATVAVIARWLTLDPERVMSTIVCVSTPAF